MSAIRKLSNFRQLSLSCESPSQKRKSLKKQFSEDITDWGEIHLKTKLPPKVAWGSELNDEVIIKKCKEVKRVPSGRLTRHPSLEKDSILNSKQELIKQKDKENDKEEKPNLQIYLAHNTQDFIDMESSQNFDNLVSSTESRQPKYLQPLLTTNVQKPYKKPKDSPKEAKRPNFSRSNTIVVVPLVEKEPESSINVIIRPITAQTRREKFQKRASSAFNLSKEVPTVTTPTFRPPLVRSSSAPTKPEKSKFLATKRKLKTGKKSPKDEQTQVEATEWKNAGHTGTDIVTMVSLISSSENEEESEEEVKQERPKSVLKKEEKEVVVADDTKSVSLRKTVKSVSFQQSSIHAVRSFSASFPARRGSMATALTLAKTTAKTQEKRATNPGSPDADERVPKRRLVRSNTDENKAVTSWQKAASQVGQMKKNETISVDIHAKGSVDDAGMKLNLEENVILVTPEENKKGEPLVEEKKEEPTYDTPKEKQCWAMYCKMTEKGINVSYDTILRGMLTPTEYRIRRRTSIADEISMMMKPPDEAQKDDPGPSSK